MMRIATNISRRLGRGAAAAGLAALGALLTAPAAFAHEGEAPARGAPGGDVILATAGAIVLTGGLLAVGVAHRRGRLRFLARVAALSERVWRVPGWSALPGELAIVSLLAALFGMYWDISWHITKGRDPGPLANPAHYFILFGLFGVFAAGFLSMILTRGRPEASSVRVFGSWWTPIGGLMLFACASFALLGFPLDDAWHRLFGQDVTLWGPTHLMLFGGATMTLIGRSALVVEGERASKHRDGQVPLILRFQRASLAGAFLIGLSTFQGEFDFGVPQFRLLFQPLLIALAAGIALVAARTWGGRGTALLAVTEFLAIRGLLALLVGPVLGRTTPHFPLYVAEALLVEAVALRVSTRRPLAFGALAGLLVGTIGTAAEWGWSHVWMPLPWPASLLPAAAIAAPLAGVAGGVLGGLIGVGLASDRIAWPRRAGVALAAASLVVAGLVGWGLVTSHGSHRSAHVTLTQVSSAPDRAVSARITLQPRDAADHAEWLSVTAWQGGGLVVDRLHRVAEGVYDTTQPIPVHGKWKAMVRLHTGDSIVAAPIYLPADKAIPKPEVPAKRSFTRPFVPDKQILQREQIGSKPWIKVAAYLTVLAIALALCGLMAWGTRRLARAGAANRPQAPPPARVPIVRPTTPVSA